MEQAKPAIFFDRDGVLNKDVHYLHKIADFVWIDGAQAAIKYANQQGYWVFVITNQSGVARGYYDETAVLRLHCWMNDELKESAAHIDEFFYCPHYKNGSIAQYAVSCDCRKPAIGMIKQAQAKYAIEMSKSILIGDKDSDMECAKNAGISGIKYTGGNLAELLAAAISENKNSGMK